VNDAAKAPEFTAELIEMSADVPSDSLSKAITKLILIDIDLR